MSMLESIAAQFPAADSRSIRDIDEEIRNELEFHLEMLTAEIIRSGMPAAKARAAAADRFGDVEQIRNECRQAQLGERIMVQRVQTAVIAVLAVAVAALGFQSYVVHRASWQAYEMQRANQAALASMASELSRLNKARPDAGAADAADRPAWAAEQPRVVETFPANGATDVDPATAEIRVTFDKEMSDGSWSWVKSSPEAFPESTGDVHYLADGKTCVMPVKLEPGTKYVVWFNTANYQNFKDREGRPAVPHLLTFTTHK
jgi:RNA polymerase sigma-70 factor (ECF subfamily)